MADICGNKLQFSADFLDAVQRPLSEGHFGVKVHNKDTLKDDPTVKKEFSSFVGYGACEYHHLWRHRERNTL